MLSNYAGGQKISYVDVAAATSTRAMVLRLAMHELLLVWPVRINVHFAGGTIKILWVLPGDGNRTRQLRL